MVLGVRVFGFGIPGSSAFESLRFMQALGIGGLGSFLGFTGLRV